MITIILGVHRNNLLRLSLRNSNTFRDRTVRGHWLRLWVLAWCAGICLLRPACALDPDKAISQYLHDQWDTDRGFIGGQVYAISESDDGYLWIGTEQGLVRFDGFNFTLIRQPIPDQPPTGAVRGLVTDAEGNMWIRIDGPRLLRYRDGRFEDAYMRFHLTALSFTSMSSDDRGGMLLAGLGMPTLRYGNGAFQPIAGAADVPGTILSLATSRDQTVWIGTRDFGLFRADGGHVVSETRYHLADRKVNSLLGAYNGGLWIGTDSGLFTLGLDGQVKVDLPSFVHKPQILAMIKDAQGNVWVGTDHGLIRISNSGAVSLDQPNPNPGNDVTAIYSDHYGSLWFGGSHGIERFRDGVFTGYSTEQGLPAGANGPVYADSDGRVWFAPASGGLYWLRGGRVERITIAGLDHDIVYSISGGNGEVWVGRQRGGLTVLTPDGDSFAARTYTQSNGLAQNSVYSVHRNGYGTVWAGTVSAGVSRLKGGTFTNYSMTNGLASNSVYSIAEGYDGTMWFATPGGLESFANGHWTTSSVRDGLPSSDVKTIFEDSNHVLWIATSGGLAYLSSGHIGVPHVLPAALREQIFGITEDRLGFLWFATSDHVVRVNRDRLFAGSLDDSDVQSYGTEDGLEGRPGIDRNRSITDDSAGRIWVSLTRGLAVVDPQRSLNNAEPVLARITSMSADGIAANLEGLPKISADTQSITFNYACTSLSNADRVRFRYKLEGSDQGWSEAVALRQVVYRNLSPGSYRFVVIASNGEGLWNGPERSLSFIVEPEFWQTWWFRVLCVAMCGLIILSLYRLRVYQLTRMLNLGFQERLGERTRIAQDLHDTLLQSFQGLILRFQTVDDMLPSRPAAAKRVLEDALDRADEALSEGRDAIQNLRYSTSSNQDLAQAMNAMMSELKEETSRDNEDAPTFSVLVEGEPRAIHPVLNEDICRIAREALRNAFNHAHAHRIETEITYCAPYLRLRVRDDGTGIEPEVLDGGGRERHWGLTGMQERAKSMHAQFNVWSKSGAGTEVELTLPGHIAYEASSGTGFRLFRRKAEQNHDHQS
jgi:ligand-binding sensor domain-containing protein/signal transduction histidine kinase